MRRGETRGWDHLALDPGTCQRDLVGKLNKILTVTHPFTMEAHNSC